MDLAFKMKVDPTKEQEDVSWILSEKSRLLYNFALGHRNKVYDETGVSPTYTMQQNDLPELKIKYPEYEWVHSKVLQMVLHQLDDDFHSFIKKRKNGDKTAMSPGYKGIDYFTTMIWNQSGFWVENGKIRLAHYYNDGKKNYIPLEFEIPEYMKDLLEVFVEFKAIKQIVFSRDEKLRKKEGQFYLSIVIEPPDYKFKDNGLYQAIDLGIGKTVCAVNMEAKFFEIKNPRVDLYWNPIIDAIQARRDHCKKAKVEEKLIDKDGNVIKDKDGKDKIIKVTKPSNRWIRLNDTKKKCHKKCSNQIEDWQHKWTEKMPRNTKSNTIIVGELPVKDMAQSGIKIKVKDRTNGTNNNSDVGKEKKTIKVKSHKLNRSTQNQGYLSKFVEFLTYKTQMIGKRTIEIPEKNTTKRCYACGKLHDIALSDRTMKCAIGSDGLPCGNVIDRDRNSAVNIMLDFLLKYNLLDGLRRFMNSLSREGLLEPIWIKI